MAFAKILRDPIHGSVGLTDRERAVIDAPVFQRLRRIKQLALTNYVFPGAVHTRFEHSLGTMEMASQMADQLTDNGVKITAEQRTLLRCAALLHDVGHGPFSHVAENFFEFPTEEGRRLGHEKASVDIIRKHPDFEFLGDQRDGIAELIEEWKRPRSFLGDIVTSTLDADKLDYLLRDSYYAGVRYGVADVERILHTLVCIPDLSDQERSFLGISYKGKEAVESLVLARYFMHNQVYLHHTRLICDAMLSRAVDLAKQDGAIDPSLFQYRGDMEYLPKYLEFDDEELLSRLKAASSSRASKLAEMIRCRSLLKECYSREVSEATFPDARVVSFLLTLGKKDMLKYEKEVAEEVKMDPGFVIISRRALTKPTYRGTPSAGILDTKTILVLGRDGRARELDAISPIFSGMRGQMPVFLSCYGLADGKTEAERKERREVIGKAAGNVIERIGG